MRTNNNFKQKLKKRHQGRFFLITIDSYFLETTAIKSNTLFE